MGMREVMQALSEGAGRQSAIGGLMFQDAQMREGRAYEAAMAKEAERRSNLEWKRRFDVSSEEARGQADIEHGYRMAEQEARLAAKQPRVRQVDQLKCKLPGWERQVLQIELRC